ncbi:MAG: hypothetical protein ABR915_04820 [Thermoguttaceae bacterium]
MFTLLLAGSGPLSVGWIAAQEPATTAAGPLTTGTAQNTAGAAASQAQALLERAGRSIETHRSISARIFQHADLFGHQLMGSGRYREVCQGAIPLIRLELKIQIAEQAASLVQVCDGRHLWTYRKLLDAETLSYIDAVRVTEALGRIERGRVEAGKGDRYLLCEAPGGPFRQKVPVPFSWPAVGLGGVSRMLRGLRDAFEFTSAQQGRVGDLAVWKIVGGWRPYHLARLLPKQKDKIEQGGSVDLGYLPEHLPDRVVLYLGQEDLFPRRIDYYRVAAPKKSRFEVKDDRTLMTVEFIDVAFDIPIADGQFVYNPGTAERSDRTEELLQSLTAGRPVPPK